MRLSDLRAQLATAGDLDAFDAYLAAPDRDGSDARLLAEAPLFRDGGDALSVTLAEIAAVHIGRSCKEVWFLLKPAAAFPPGVLPG